MRQEIKIRREGDQVLILFNGLFLGEMPWEKALAVADAIRSKAKLAEEHAKAQEIINDQALLIDKGLPLGLTNNRKILKEAITELGGRHIKTEAVVGAPSILMEK